MATKFLLLLAAALLSAPAANAEVKVPAAYEQLTAVPQKPGQAPRLLNGVSDLSVRESSHREKLPMQLDGALTKIKRAKYAPKRQRIEKLPIARSAKAEKKASARKIVQKTAQKSKVKTVFVGQAKSFEENLPMPAGTKPAAQPSARFDNEAL